MAKWPQSWPLVRSPVWYFRGFDCKQPGEDMQRTRQRASRTRVGRLTDIQQNQTRTLTILWQTTRSLQPHDLSVLLRGWEGNTHAPTLSNCIAVCEGCSLQGHHFAKKTAENVPGGFNLFHVQAPLPLQKDKFIKTVIRSLMIKYFLWWLPALQASASLSGSITAPALSVVPSKRLSPNSVDLVCVYVCVCVCVCVCPNSWQPV